MTSHSDKERRKALAKEAAERIRKQATAEAPLTKAELDALCDFLDESLSEGCDHSHRFTRTFLACHKLPEDRVVSWLGENGGYCDCEVLANVEGTL